MWRGGLGPWARRASVACFMRVEEERERWSMISERERFLRMGFFVAKELVRERAEVGGEEEASKMRVLPGWRGP